MYICTIITGAALEDYHKTDEVTVAKSFAASAEALKAQFVLNTGDNFYYYTPKSKLLMNVIFHQKNSDSILHNIRFSSRSVK